MSEYKYLDMLRENYSKHIRSWSKYCMNLSKKEWDLCYGIIMEKSSKRDYDTGRLWEMSIFDEIIKMDRKVRILDIGCFNGFFLYKLHTFNFKNLYGIDCNEYAVDTITKAFEDRNIEGSFKVSSIEEIDFDDNYFDVVICIEVIEHIRNVKASCSEIHRILKSGGKAFLSFPKENKVESYCHINYFSEHEKAPKDMKGCINFYSVGNTFDRNLFNVDIDTMKDGKEWFDRIYMVSLTKKDGSENE